MLWLPKGFRCAAILSSLKVPWKYISTASHIATSEVLWSHIEVNIISALWIKHCESRQWVTGLAHSGSPLSLRILAWLLQFCYKRVLQMFYAKFVANCSMLADRLVDTFLHISRQLRCFADHIETRVSVFWSDWPNKQEETRKTQETGSRFLAWRACHGRVDETRSAEEEENQAQ